MVLALLRALGPSPRLRFGGCFAAEERLRRWPDEAEKAFDEATADEFQRSRGARNDKRRHCAWLEKCLASGGNGGSTAQGYGDCCRRRLEAVDKKVQGVRTGAGEVEMVWSWARCPV